MAFVTASEKTDEAAEPVAPLRKVKKKGKKGKQVDLEAANGGQAPPVPGGMTPTFVSAEDYMCQHKKMSHAFYSQTNRYS